MTKWEAALAGNKLLNSESKKQIWTQFTFNNAKLSPYGMGWRISEVRDHKLVGHTGQTAGFGAAIFRYVQNDVTVIALTNLGEVGMGSLVAVAAAKSGSGQPDPVADEEPGSARTSSSGGDEDTRMLSDDEVDAGATVDPLAPRAEDLENRPPRV